MSQLAYRHSVIADAAELTVKIRDLESFIRSLGFKELSTVDRELLVRKVEAMSFYLDILQEQIRNWKN